MNVVYRLQGNENYMNQIEENIKLQIKPRATEAVLLQIPVDAMRSLEEVAASRDMSIDALLKFYIGNGLREDKAKLFSDRLNPSSQISKAIAS